MSKNICAWGDNDLMRDYHDNEWGKVCHDDKVMFEFIILESAQAGLSWSTIMKKREAYRVAYDNFDVEKVASYDDKKIEELIENKGIVRNKLKINASINNANCFMKIQQEFGSFDKYIWSFTNNKVVKGEYKTDSCVPTSTELSDVITKDMKKRGFKFIGTTIVYSYLQAMGIVNDHILSCHAR